MTQARQQSGRLKKKQRVHARGYEGFVAADDPICAGFFCMA
jgi:hypothetical protein